MQPPPTLPQVPDNDEPLCSCGSLTPRVHTEHAEAAEDLIDNECTQVIQKTSFGATLLYSYSEKDLHQSWCNSGDTHRLRELRKIIRSLFWAFQDIEQLSEKDVKLVPRGLRLLAHRTVHTDAFSWFFGLLTVYALFGPDAAMALGHSSYNLDDQTLAVLNTFVLMFFVLEEVLFSLANSEYFCSLRFWVDTFATASIVGDTLLGSELVKSDAAVAGRGSRLLRMVRVGGRSTRVVRLLRLARVVQVLRFVPRLQDCMERSTNDLALLLWHKRMRHVFHYLDRSGIGVLADVDLELAHQAMVAEFGGTTAEQQPEQSIGRRILGATMPIKRASTELPDDRVADDGTFSMVLHEWFRSAAGKNAFKRCVDDIHCMKESCAMLENAIGRLTLKVSILVLVLLIMMQLLEDEDHDLTQIQGLHQLDAMALHPQGNLSLICSMVLNDYLKASASAALLLLVLDRRIYWSSECPCEPGCAGNGPQKEDGGVARASKVMKAAGYESHEFASHAVLSGHQEVRSLAVFDIHRSERARALFSMANTASVVVLLVCLVVYFALDMKQISNNNVLNPLWALLDDMCALKLIDVVGEQRCIAEDDIHTLVSLHLSDRSRYGCARCQREIAVADELKQLQQAFRKLRMVMRSWSKFVPVVLLKRLLAAGVEAKIGCSHCEVSVFFCDIDNFEGLWQGATPREVLAQLEQVYSQIHEALADNGGTLLEFIGDEILAVFNAPSPVSQHSVCAVTAALEAQERLDQLPGHRVRLRCSVHKASILIGNIGSPSRMKYGALGDGVNLSARLKSLNTRYGTHLLVSCDALDPHTTDELFVTRPVGKLVLKGRTTPTMTYEVLGKRSLTSASVVEAAGEHSKAFELFLDQRFDEAKVLFGKVSDMMSALATPENPELPVVTTDRPSQHLKSLCEKYSSTPPPYGWDGSEHLNKKVW